MKLAIVGGGVSGLCCAYFLQQQHDVTLFEEQDWMGGHTHTVTASDLSASNAGSALFDSDKNIAVDTGFIVYNNRTYPVFSSILENLKVKTQSSDMSFSVRCDGTGLEYGAGDLAALFAQPANGLSPGYWSFLASLLRFNHRVKKAFGNDEFVGKSLGDFVRAHGFSDRLIRLYLVPICAAIWSARPGAVLDIPFAFFASFFVNHGLVNLVNRPEWRVVSGGSARYVDALLQGLNVSIHRSTPALSIDRHDTGVDVISDRFGRETFDATIIATHSDQALSLIRRPTINEKTILSAIGYQQNRVVLHTDSRFMPRAHRAWSSWNYLVDSTVSPTASAGNPNATVTYHMNRLQRLSSKDDYFVTLNPSMEIAPQQYLGEWLYSHPVFDEQAIAMRERVRSLGGMRNRVWFCGSYCGNGFHEDGVVSALRVSEDLTKECGYECATALADAVAVRDESHSGKLLD